jgi:hypothetical protein
VVPQLSHWLGSLALSFVASVLPPHPLVRPVFDLVWPLPVSCLHLLSYCSDDGGSKQLWNVDQFLWGSHLHTCCHEEPEISQVWLSIYIHNIAPSAWSKWKFHYLVKLDSAFIYIWFIVDTSNRMFHCFIWLQCS